MGSDTLEFQVELVEVIYFQRHAEVFFFFFFKCHKHMYIGQTAGTTG